MVLVSIIVPMYNAEAFISATLASILQECHIPLEVVVVDNGSTDASLDKVRAIEDKRVRLIHCQCKGIAAALNAGIAEVRGDIVMRCDADDLYPSQRLARQVEWLSRHPEFGAVCGGFSTIDVKGRTIVSFTGEDSQEITEELRNGNTRTHLCTFAVRAEVLRSTGGCRQYFLTAEDIDLQLRIGELCRVWYLPEVEYNYRLHNNSITHTQSNVEREFFELMAREFQRQRRTQGTDDLQRGCPPTPPREGRTGSAMNSQEHTQGLLMGIAWQEHQSGHKFQALAIGMRSVITQPSNVIAWRSLLALAVKPARRQRGHD